MAFEFDFITFLKSKLAITALTGQRITPVKRNQKLGLPAITSRRGGGGHQHTLSGGSGRAQPIMVVECYAESYDEAVNLGAIVFRELVGFRGPIGEGTHVTSVVSVDDFDQYEEPVDGSDAGVFIREQHYMVQYREAIPTPSP